MFVFHLSRSKKWTHILGQIQRYSDHPASCNFQTFAGSPQLPNRILSLLFEKWLTSQEVTKMFNKLSYNVINPFEEFKQCVHSNIRT
jgi:hypothetical protein